jgi:hypothetical protein
VSGQSHAWTVFAAMRPFVGEFAALQRNAILSWLGVRPAGRVVLVDDEAGTTAAAVVGLPVTIRSGVRRSGLGAPLFDSFVELGGRDAVGDTLVCTTADVLFPPRLGDVLDAVRREMRGRDYLVVAGRHDVRAAPDVGQPSWFESLRADVRPDYRRGIDMWAYPSRMALRPPPFPIGRHGTDGWVVYDMKRRGIPVIDITAETPMIHQTHGKPAAADPRFHDEMLDCVRLFDGMAERAMNLLDADLLWRNGRLTRPRGLRRLHASMSLFTPYRFFVGQRRRYKLPHLYRTHPEVLSS